MGPVYRQGCNRGREGCREGDDSGRAGLALQAFRQYPYKDLKTSIRACSVICHDIRVEALEPLHQRKENGEIFKNLKNTIIAMKLKIKKTNFISSIDSWYRFAPPERGDSQWVDGRSAKEFAKYMLSEAGKMPSEIEKYIKSLGWECHDCDCFPEHVTNFLLEYGTGSGRHHDALFVSKDWVVGVESKVSESFDSRIEDWLEKGKKNKDGGKNRKARIKESLRLITGQAYSDKDIESEAILDLRYQLISATVGTILEAKNHNIRKAALLVVEFQGNVLKEKGYMKNINTNSKDYQSFLDFLQIGEKNDLERKIEVKIDIDYTLSIWFKKIPINVLGPKYSVAE